MPGVAMKNKPIHLPNDAIDRVIDRKKVLENLKIAFNGLSTGKSVQPKETKTEFPAGKGDCIFYPAVVADLGLIGIATSPFICDNLDKNLSPVTAYTLLLSLSNGEPVLFCDSLYLTTIRTAATTLLASKLLLTSNNHKLTIVGCGPIGLEHAKFACMGELFTHIEMVSPALCDSTHPKHLDRKKSIAQLGREIGIGESIETSVRNADVVMLCTSSGTPVVQAEWIRKAQLITSISTNARNAHEIDPLLLANLDVYCDYRHTTPTTAAEFRMAAEIIGWSSNSVIADLGELIAYENKSDNRPQSTNNQDQGSGKISRCKYFRSTGLGIQDVAVGASFLDALNQCENNEIPIL
jgi:L-arginine dehydrogenase